jgi:hypothetical protein
MEIGNRKMQMLGINLQLDEEPLPFSLRLAISAFIINKILT